MCVCVFCKFEIKGLNFAKKEMPIVTYFWVVLTGILELCSGLHLVIGCSIFLQVLRSGGVTYMYMFMAWVTNCLY